MAPPSHLPDDPGSADLGDVLRQAVRQIRSAPPPEDAVGRALGRAARLGQPPPRRWLPRRIPVFAGGTIAALLLVAVGLVAGYPTGGYLAQPRTSPNAPPMEPINIAGDQVAALDLPMPGDAAPRMLVQGPRGVLGFGGLDPAPDGGLFAGNWAGWDHVQNLRHITQGMSAIDRKGIESYLRLLTGRGRLDPVNVWHQDSRPLPHARIQETASRALTLQGVAIQVLVEGPRARTLVDHIFSNPHDHPIDGTFEYPLPDGASPSYFALFPGGGNSPQAAIAPVAGQALAPRPTALPTPAEAAARVSTECWGQPRTARVVPQAADPDVIEVAGFPMPAEFPVPAPTSPSFRGRIGSVPAKAMIRVLFAFEETLPLRNGKVAYTHRLPSCTLQTLSVAVQADAHTAKQSSCAAEVQPGRNALDQDVDDATVTYRGSWKKVTPTGSLRFQAVPPTAAIQCAGGSEGTHHYLLARLRPDLGTPAALPPYARHAVFLLDTSAGEHPDRFARCMKLLRTILEQDRDLTQFNVLVVNTAAAWLEPKGWFPNTTSGRDAALARLDGIVLEGATDFSRAVEALVEPTFTVPRRLPVQCFVLSDGRLTLGESDLALLTARLHARIPFAARWHCYQMGLGDENGELYDLLTRQNGGTYRCLADRDVPTAAAAHRRPCLQIEQVRFEGDLQGRDLLVAGRRAALQPGGELLLAARFGQIGSTTIVVEGRIGTRRFLQRFPAEVRDGGQLAARGWGELAVGGLLALNDPRVDGLGVALGQQYAVASRATVFALTDETRPPREEPLPLKGDLGNFVDLCWEALGKTTAFRHRRDAVAGQLHQWVGGEAARKDIRAILDQLPPTEFTLPEAPAAGEWTRRADAAAAYLSREPKAVAPVLDETDRRRRAGDAAGAVRCVCGLLEEHPNNPDVARLVAYHLVGTGQPALAARLLTEHVEQHPTDPAAHRALAVALHECRKLGRAALHYEAALAQLGTRSSWHEAVRDEYVHLLGHALREPELPLSLRTRFVVRLRELQSPAAAGDLRVHLTWANTSAMLDLRVIDAAGGEVKADDPQAGTSGQRTGPRRLRATGRIGEQVVQVRLNRLTPEAMPEAFATVQILRQAGTRQATLETKRVLLRARGEWVEVAKVEAD